MRSQWWTENDHHHLSTKTYLFHHTFRLPLNLHSGCSANRNEVIRSRRKIAINWAIITAKYLDWFTRQHSNSQTDNWYFCESIILNTIYRLTFIISQIRLWYRHSYRFSISQYKLCIKLSTDWLYKPWVGILLTIPKIVAIFSKGYNASDLLRRISLKKWNS